MTAPVHLDAVEDPEAAVDQVVEALLAGGVVVLPTDTVYGLAALPGDAAATARVFDLNGRAHDTPMAVLGDHRVAPSDDERAFMIEALSLVARTKYGEDRFIIDGVMRQIPDHCHIHARPIMRFGD